MGGSMFNGRPVKHEFVENLADTFMTMVIPDTDYIIAGSYRRGKELCGDIELVIPCDSMTDLARVNTHIMKQFGSTASLTPRMHGLYGEVQYDLFPVRRHQMGAMLLHATGSGAFNVLMRRKAHKRGLLLNQYGLFKRSTNEPVVISSEEGDFFKYLWMDFVDPKDRSIK